MIDIDLVVPRPPHGRHYEASPLWWKDEARIKAHAGTAEIDNIRKFGAESLRAKVQ